MGTYGISKKKSKNKSKQDKRVTPKAKEKAKKAKQIEGGKRLRDSKRAAAAASGKADKDPDLKGISSVDELFASDIFEEKPEGEDEEDSGSEGSSAGGFRDVDDGDDDDEGLDQDFEEALGEDDGPESHEKELEAIKKSDPAFYAFLVENDKQLLNFKDAAEDDEKDGEEAEEDGEKAGPEPAGAARTVTVARIKKLQENARTSFTAFKALLTAYHSAIRSIESGGAGAAMGEQDDEEEDTGRRGKKGNRSKNRRQKVRESLMHISDEATFSEIIEWTVGNVIELLQHYGGELKDDGAYFVTLRRPWSLRSPPECGRVSSGPWRTCCFQAACMRVRVYHSDQLRI